MLSTPDAFFGELRALLHTPRPTKLHWSRLRALLARAFHPDTQPQLADAEVAQFLEYATRSIEKSEAWQGVRRSSLTHWLHAAPHAPERKALALCNHIVLDAHTIEYAAWERYIRFENITALECTLTAEQVPLLAKLLSRTPLLQHLLLKGEGALSLDLEPLSGGEDSSHTPRLQHLTKLEILHARLGDYGFDHLVNLPWLPQLECINLESNHLTNEHLVHLSKLPLHRLEELILEFNHFEESGMQALCSSSTITQLKHLNLSLCHLTAESVRPLCEARWGRSLERLDLSFNLLQEDGVAHLASCDFPNLRALHIDNQEQHSGLGITTLAKAPFLPHIRSLSACFDTHIPSSTWAEELLPRMTGALEAIDLSHNCLDDRVIQRLKEAFAGRPVKRLELSNCGHDVSAERLLWLLSSTDLRQLESLSLSATPLTDDDLFGIDHNFEQLEELHIEELKRIGPGFTHVLSCIEPYTLSWLSMGRQTIEDATASGKNLSEVLANQNIETLYLTSLHETDEALILELLQACAPTLQTLELRQNAQLSQDFLERLWASTTFPALSYLGWSQCDATNAQFENVLRQVCVAGVLPNLTLLTWQGNEELTQGLRSLIPETLHLID